MTTKTTSDEIFKQNLKCHKLVSQDPVKLVCASPKSSGQALVQYFCQNSTLSNVKKFNKTPVSILSQYCIQTLKRLASNPIAISSPAVILCPLITVNYRSRFTRLCNSFIGKNVVSDKTYCSSSANENESSSN